MGGKHIVLCSDGTGNTAIKARGTNVFKLYEAVDIHGHKYDTQLTPQVAFYDDGVGTSQFAPLKLFSGAFGWGFAKNVRDLYTELVHIYDPGDQLFLFGFSRGAYTIRTLAGMIQYCGILDRHNMAHETIGPQVKQLWSQFRQRAFSDRSDEQRQTNQPSVGNATLERARRENFGAIIHPEHAPDGAPEIAFLGVWDTVGAIGAPFEEVRNVANWFYPMRFDELTPSKRIRRACHALSIDDDRLTFRPELWNEQYAREGQVEQVWFAGVHSNVGGGYVKHGMSLVALDWMMTEAERCGLRFLSADRGYVRTHQDVHDELYNARKGAGVYYRWEPRNIAKLCQAHHIQIPKIHASVFERLANGTGRYAPANLPYRFSVVRTDDTKPWLSKLTQREIERRLTPPLKGNSIEHERASLLDLMGRDITSGKRSYQAFLILSLPLLLLWLAWKWVPSIATPLLEKFPYPTVLTLLLAGLHTSLILLAWQWSKRVDRRMMTRAQDHWHPQRDGLRKLFTNGQSADGQPTMPSLAS